MATMIEKRTPNQGPIPKLPAISTDSIIDHQKKTQF
jgi:hypothetical protein